MPRAVFVCSVIVDKEVARLVIALLGIDVLIAKSTYVFVVYAILTRHIHSLKEGYSLAVSPSQNTHHVTLL